MLRKMNLCIVRASLHPRDLWRALYDTSLCEPSKLGRRLSPDDQNGRPQLGYLSGDMVFKEANRKRGGKGMVGERAEFVYP